MENGSLGGILFCPLIITYRHKKLRGTPKNFIDV